MVGGQLCAWGKLKAAGDSTMYPKPYMDLSGWNIRNMACGNTTFACAAHAEGDQSVVTWSGPCFSRGGGALRDRGALLPVGVEGTFTRHEESATVQGPSTERRARLRPERQKVLGQP